jgi:serine/threonine protein kinase
MRACASHNLTKLHAVYEDLDNIYLVLDLCNEGTLLDLLLCSGPVEEDQAKAFVRSLLEGLVYLHRSGIIHRDIKLENLLLRNHSTCVIADMGLARFLDADGKISGEKCGSIGYIAPELFNSQSYDCKADVFSTGCVAYSLLTATAPFGSNRNCVGLHNAWNRVMYDRAVWQELSEDALAFV